ncbi:DedA family protein [Priestia megaterium]|uniref:DedA family protein n=1 Tax=Priestia megaterium TaxID=1404 RepID=A0A6M6E1T1_PRIMG|nr:DedA family protein [Priestia megaterium]QJX80902.1 DedA family protein [Priestia megaterium]
MNDLILEAMGFLKQLSYFGILLALCFEFVPAEIVLPLAGYWIYEGEFNIHLMALAGTIGGTVGPMTLYALGKYGGRPMVERYGKFFLVNQKQIDASDRFFNKYGASVAFVARFLPLVRTAISIPCGIAKMNFVKFSIYTFLAMYPITYLYLYLGLKLGPHWSQAGELLSRYTQPIVIIVLAVVVVYIIIRIAKKKKEAEVT